MRRPQIVEKISDMMHHEHPDVEVYLYGSEARGDARPDSDIDMLVLVDMNGPSFRKKKHLISNSLLDVQLSTDTDINPYIVPRDWWYKQAVVTPFYINVNKERVKI